MSDVEGIVKRFAQLNPYDPTVIRDLLKIEGVNFDRHGRLQALRGVAISSKRYALFLRRWKKLLIIEPKAHGLGYLYAPRDDRKGPPWHVDAWSWILPTILGASETQRKWFDRPALMKVVVNTPNVLRKAARSIRPFNFVFYVLVHGYPGGVDRDQFTLIAPFTKRRRDWLYLPCLNVHDGRSYRLALKQTSRHDKVIPQTIGSVLRLYIDHVEAKSLAPGGGPCLPTSRGLLQRTTVVTRSIELIGKEADRRWQHGEDISLMDSKIARYGSQVRALQKASRQLRDSIRAVGIRATIRRTGLSQHTIEKILLGRRVRHRTLLKLVVSSTS